MVRAGAVVKAALEKAVAGTVTVGMAAAAAEEAMAMVVVKVGTALGSIPPRCCNCIPVARSAVNGGVVASAAVRACPRRRTQPMLPSELWRLSNQEVPLSRRSIVCKPGSATARIQLHAWPLRVAVLDGQVA